MDANQLSEELKKVGLDHYSDDVRLDLAKELLENLDIKYKSNSRFKKPTISEIKNYCKERNNKIDAEQFFDFYESKNWMIGKNKMKNWQAAVRTWERNQKKNEPEDFEDEVPYYMKKRK